MNPDLANLLGALRDQPDDEIASLALADWCLEQSAAATQARGEHVRLSVALSKVSTLTAEGKELRNRVKSLEKRYRVAWLGSLRNVAHRCEFLPGGLVKAAFTDGRTIQARGSRVNPPRVEDFAWVSHFTAWSISLDALRWLGDLLPVGYVRYCELWYPHENQPGPVRAIHALGRGQFLDGVRSLRISARIGNAGVIRLADLDALRHLSVLHLLGSDISSEGFAALGELLYQRRIRDFALTNLRISGDDLRVLLIDSFASLSVLSLENTLFGVPEAEALARWNGLAGVRRLTLDRNPLTDSGLSALAESLYLKELRVLSVPRCELTSRGVSSLARAPLSKLETLDIRGNDRIADAGFMALCQSSSLAGLRTIMHDRFGLRAETQAALNARFQIMNHG